MRLAPTYLHRLLQRKNASATLADAPWWRSWCSRAPRRSSAHLEPALLSPRPRLPRRDVHRRSRIRQTDAKEDGADDLVSPITIALGVRGVVDQIAPCRPREGFRRSQPREALYSADHEDRCRRHGSLVSQRGRGRRRVCAGRGSVWGEHAAWRVIRQPDSRVDHLARPRWIMANNADGLSRSVQGRASSLRDVVDRSDPSAASACSRAEGPIGLFARRDKQHVRAVDGGCCDGRSNRVAAQQQEVVPSLPRSDSSMFSCRPEDTTSLP